MSANVVEVHPQPHRHLVMDGETWETVKAAIDSPASAPSPLCAPLVPLLGLPVYLDACPWLCTDEGPQR